MKWFLSITFAVLAVFAGGDVIAQDNHTPPCRARTHDLPAMDLHGSLLFQVFGIDQNFFALNGGSGPIDLNGTTGPISPELVTVKWNDPVQYNSINNSWNSPSFSVDCGIDFGEVVKPKGKSHTSAVTDTTADSCQAWAQWGCDNARSQSTAQLAIDTLEHYIESCARTDSNSYMALGCIIQATNWAPSQFQQIRQWLESVMGVSGIQNYLCAILNDISLTYQRQAPSDYNDAVAVLDYEICCVPCIPHDSADLAGFWGSRTYFRSEEIQNYQDTVKDPIATPIDTTEPTMHDLGLDSLVKYFGELGVQNGSLVSIIINATAYPNPTGEGTIVTFSIAKEAYVKITLYDILGHEVASPGFEGLFEPGNHEVPLDLQSLPGGTYFARIMTAFGSVETVKIVKE